LELNVELLKKRMMGFEPTTFCMARNVPAGRGTVAPTAARRAPKATIEEAALAASCLVALPGTGYGEAAPPLKARPKERLVGGGLGVA
jgi:hypothetical protein